MLNERFAPVLPLLSDRTDIALDSTKRRFIPLHSHNQSQFIASLDPGFFCDEVVYISDAGMPSICDPGAELVRYCLEHSISYDVLPGACALVAGFAHSGISSQEFVFGGFLAHKKQDKKQQILRLLESSAPIIFYESPHRVLESVRDIAELVPSAFMVAIKEISKLHQSRTQGTPQEVLQALEHANIQGEWILVLHAKALPKISLYESDVFSLPLAPKHKAKLLSRLNGIDTKTLYEQIIRDQGKCDEGGL
ncbi:hypothetical protein HMPREF2087_00080 [Helicobacter canis NCTC 12740]|uniref:Tetrapyrrole methylase domain-containing protein n=1 Tax=Helicobacter canis NCTC 12740 TaxID=1357399 RepID=V8CJA3_9HELI|nr:hypothetical protein HMPREF2087_00080 [Helicobacter canis NCTC 12740]